MSQVDKKEFPIYGIENNLPEEKNAHIHIAVGFFDALARVQTIIPRSVWRLFWFVVRKTLGFQGAGKQKGDFLSCRQISGGIGTQRQTVPRLIRCGEKLNLIHVGRDKDGKLLRNPKTGQRGYFITPNMDISTWKVKLSPPKVSHPTASLRAHDSSEVSHPTASEVYLPVNTPGVITASDTLMNIKKGISKVICSASASASAESATSPMGKKGKMPEAIDRELAELLKEKIQQNNPMAIVKDSQLATWADEIRLMRTVDKRRPEDIRAVILWCQDDRFWRKNIESAGKLRKQFARLWMEMKEPTGKKEKSLEELNREDEEALKDPGR